MDTQDNVSYWECSPSERCSWFLDWLKENGLWRTDMSSEAISWCHDVWETVKKQTEKGE